MKCRLGIYCERTQCCNDVDIDFDMVSFAIIVANFLHAAQKVDIPLEVLLSETAVLSSVITCSFYCLIVLRAEISVSMARTAGLTRWHHPGVYPLMRFFSVR